MNLRGPQRGKYFDQLRSFGLLKLESPSLGYSIIGRTMDFGLIIERYMKKFMGHGVRHNYKITTKII